MKNTPKIKTILIVEDDYQVRLSLREILEAEGYHVVTAENGVEGLEKIRALPTPRLVLLDFMMPVMGGQEFLNEVLKDSIIAPIPVVIVSSCIGNGSAPGAVRILKKPVDLNLLVSVVKQYTD